MSLAEVENMAALLPFTLEGSGACSPRKFLVILGVMRCILKHTEKHTELLENSSVARSFVLAGHLAIR